MASSMDAHLFQYGFEKGKITKSKWKISKEIKDFRNLKRIDFEFIRGGTTIIVGANNIGKTNLLDYIYEKNKSWDEFEVDDRYYEQERSREGKLLSHRRSSEIFSLFFPDFINNGSFPYTYHKSYLPLVEKLKQSIMILSYKIYYFDLTASTYFLTEKGKKDLKVNKAKFRSCELLYGKSEEDNKSIDSLRNYYIIESKKEKKEEIQPWTPRFDNRDNFIKHQDEEKIVYYGLNQSVSHPLDRLGSGYLKIETIKSLVESLKGEEQELEKDDDRWFVENQRLPFSSFIHTPILLMDEPEVFLHPSLISKLAETIKGAGEKNITTILATHSPALLSHFTNELFTKNEASLVILRKDEKDGKIKKPLCFDKLVEKIKKEIDEIWKKYCPCFKEETEGDNNFYYNKWKVLLNERTLKLFFAKKILFVEGMTDYVFFTSEFIRREIPSLKEIEIVPIFGKFNYVFLSKLAKELDIKYRFLLDKDNNSIKEAKREVKGTKLKGCEHEPKCTKNQAHKAFWDIHTGNKLEEKSEDIIYDEEGDIDWFQDDIEHFLEIESKDTFTVSKELAMLSSTNSLDRLKSSDPEKVEKWKKRVNKLKKVVEKITQTS